MSLDNRISLKKLEVFCAVVEHGSVSDAAEELRIAQPGVSAHLRTLQERLGVRLLERSHGRVALTEAGRAVHLWAGDVLSRSNELSREIDALVDGSGGSAVIAASMTAGTCILPPIMVRFKRSRPSASMSVNICHPEQAQELIETSEADFSVIHTDRPEVQGNLFHERLRYEELMLVAPLHGGTDRKAVTIAELVDVPFVCAPEGATRRMFDRVLARNGLEKRNIVMGFAHAEATLRGVREGLGVAVVFRSSVDGRLEASGLREIRVTDASMSVPLYLSYRRDKTLSSLQRDLIEEIKESLGEPADPSAHDDGAADAPPAALSAD